jgi:putative flippase GtrA
MIAIVSIIINLCFQILSVAKYKGIFYIEVSILVGTAAGMPLRYWLEKIYIFSFRARNLLHDGRLFFFYTLMAVFTTFIFWGVEYLFHYLFQSDPMRYLGGLLGLTLGFFIKYQLDKRYVFVSKGQDIA